jgi:hypothetical protein
VNRDRGMRSGPMMSDIGSGSVWTIDDLVAMGEAAIPQPKKRGLTKKQHQFQTEPLSDINEVLVQPAGMVN